MSLPPQLAAAVDEAATKPVTFSAWLADAAEHRLRIQAGQSGLAQCEVEHGPPSASERAEGLARARELLGRTSAAARRSA